MEKYLLLLKQGWKIEKFEQYSIIHTPFAFSNFDLIDIIVQNKENFFILSDDKETFMNLEFSGININYNNKLLDKIFNLYGLELLENNEIVKKTNHNNIGNDIYDFIQGILAIDNLFFFLNDEI